MKTNQDLLSRFRDDGYVAIRPFLVDNELIELVSQVDRFISDVLPEIPSEQAFYEHKANRSTLKQIQHMGDFDSWFHQLFTASRFRQLAEQLLGGPVVPKNLQYFNKPPGIGLATPPHQDGYYFMLDPCEAVTMWLALEDVDEETGCVRYVRGSHKRGMRRHARTETLGFSQGIADYPLDTDRRYETACPSQAGDLLVHDAMTIHRADGNHSSNRSRRALGLVYFSERAREDKAAQDAYQRMLTDDLKSKGKL